MSFFITTDAVGGVWTYSLALARGVAERGECCTLAVLGPAPETVQWAEASAIPGCTILYTGLPLEWTLTNSAALDELIRALMGIAQDVHATSAHLHAPALAAHAWPIPVLAVAHSCMATWWDAVRGGPRPPEIAWHARATSAGLDRADMSVAPSHAFAAELTAAYRPKRPLRTIHNGTPSLLQPGRGRSDYVLAAGRLWDESKNIGLLDCVAAFSAVPILAAGLCAAPGGEAAHFGHLRLLGNLSSAELHVAMARAAVFASPAVYEPFGLAVLEAASLGTPLVLADTPVFRELWKDAALFVPARDAQAWAKTIAALLADVGARQRLGAAAHDHARRYTQARMVTSTMALHQTLRQRARKAA